MNLTLSRHVFFLIACLVGGSFSYAQDERDDPIGREVGNFELRHVDGRPFSLSECNESELVVVAFVGQECPLVRLYVPRLKELQETYKDRGVAWIAIDSNQQDSLTELQHFRKSMELSFPLLKDPGNRIADLFSAQRTPEVFVLDRSATIRYRGRIDDQYTYGRQRPQATSNDLADALDALLAGKEVANPSTDAPGCIIGRVLTQAEGTLSSVTYSNQISRLLQKNCVSCHRAGEIGPFELTNYEEVVGWAGMIQEVVNERRMPPWHANPDHGQFRNDCRLTADEIDLINQWVENGAPQGDVAELPKPVTFATGWRMGEPDLVLPMAKEPYPVPATGVVEYEYFVVDPGFTKDMWVAGAECRPDKRAVVHHMIIGVIGEGEFSDGDGVHGQLNSDWIVATAPGGAPLELQTGYAKRIPAGSKLIFQMHYTPNGLATEDLSSVGLKFVEADTVTHQVFTLKAWNDDFRIPAGELSHRVRASYQFRQDVEMLGLFSHMHLRGKSFRYTLQVAGNPDEVVLDVPEYDFNWQNAYNLQTPRTIRKGSRMSCVAHFDNSENNLANPDPDEVVRWGDQTWEEMMIGYFDVAVPREQE